MPIEPQDLRNKLTITTLGEQAHDSFTLQERYNRLSIKESEKLPKFEQSLVQEFRRAIQP